jgi:putative hydrolase
MDDDQGNGGFAFSGVPFLGDIAKALSGQGPLSWDAARQFAAMTATQGVSERNVDPAVRFQFAELARVAELHLGAASDLDVTIGGRAPEIVPVTAGRWADRTLEAYRPLFTDLATSLGSRGPGSPGGANPGADLDTPGADPALAMLGQFGALLQPMMLGMAVGSMVGHLARRSFGQYDLPIPRPASAEIIVVPAALDEFASDWSLPHDEVRLWVVLQELAGHAVLNTPNVRTALTDLVQAHVSGFRPDPSALFDRITNLEVDATDPMTALQAAFGDPETLLGAVRSPEQVAMAPRLDAVVTAVVGYVDHVVDRVAARLIPQAGQLAEAVRRRRVEASSQDVFVEQLLGLRLTRQAVDRGRAFVNGVVERAGDAGLAHLFASVEALPTPNEIEAPGLWLARLDVDF